MNMNDIKTITEKAIELDKVLEGLDPQMLHEVFRLTLAGRSDDELKAIWMAAKARYEGITAKDVYNKIPKFEVSVKRK